MGLLDRRVGRQRRHRGRFRRLHDGVVARPGGQQPRHGAVGGRCRLAPHVRERARGPAGRMGPGRHDGAEVRAAGPDRHHRPVLPEGRPLHAVHPRRTRGGTCHPRVLRGHHGRDRVHPVGLHRARVGDGAGRGSEGPRADHPAGDDVGHGRDDADLRDRDDRGHGDPPARRARTSRTRRSPRPRPRSSAAAGRRWSGRSG